MIINNKKLKSSYWYFLLILVHLASCTMQQKKSEKESDYYIISEKEPIQEKKITKERFEQRVYSNEIKSIEIGVENLKSGEPCYKINSGKPLQVEFDLLNEHAASIQFELIHCDRNWVKSDLMEMEFIEGYASDYIEGITISSGTINQYVHYNFKIPNNNTKFLISGNYILKVFEEEQSDTPLFTVKIFVSEQTSDINFKLLESNDMEQRKYLQSYELNCTFNTSTIEDPYNNILVNIQQNHQEFDEQWLSGPNFIRENKLVFLPTEERTFNGGNEFRFFDISSFRSGSQKVEKLFFEENEYHVILKKESKRSYKQYLEYKDLDGRSFIRSYDADDASSEGEYGIVHFELPIREILEEKVFLFGQLTNWSIDEKHQMKYDSISKSYKCEQLLKQGYYNYIYVTKKGDFINTRQLEGAHFDANNEYVIKVYYLDPVNLYDRLLSYQVFKITT